MPDRVLARERAADVIAAAERATLGVGIIGAGAVTQAIHLPTIAGLGDRLRVVHVADPNLEVARGVADRADARASDDHSTLLEDPVVDVVAICSPPEFHPAQIDAAVAAGKRTILCEKPLAIDHAGVERIAGTCTERGVALIVGNMHVWDPAYVAAQRRWHESGEDATLVRSTIYLPANEKMVSLSTDLLAPASQAPGPDPRPGAEAAAARMRGAVLGLAIHNTPITRQLVPTVDFVTFAANLDPWGYAITFHGGGRSVELLGLMPGRWPPEWTVQAWGRATELRVSFPPSYVLAGSSTAEILSIDGRTSWAYPRNGYQAEWLHLADVADERAELAIPVADAIADVRYALEIADRAASLVRGAVETER